MLDIIEEPNEEWDEILSDMADPVRNGCGTWKDVCAAAVKRGIPSDYVHEYIEFEQNYPNG